MKTVRAVVRNGQWEYEGQGPVAEDGACFAINLSTVKIRNNGEDVTVQALADSFSGDETFYDAVDTIFSALENKISQSMVLVIREEVS